MSIHVSYFFPHVIPNQHNLYNGSQIAESVPKCGKPCILEVSKHVRRTKHLSNNPCNRRQSRGSRDLRRRNNE